MNVDDVVLSKTEFKKTTVSAMHGKGETLCIIQSKIVGLVAMQEAGELAMKTSEI